MDSGFAAPLSCLALKVLTVIVIQSCRISHFDVTCARGSWCIVTTGNRRTTKEP
jgi:hypothetical protein